MKAELKKINITFKPNESSPKSTIESEQKINNPLSDLESGDFIVKDDISSDVI